MVDLARRRFLTGRHGSAAPPIRPPWTTPRSLADFCTGCGACIDACPERILAMGRDDLPRVDFSAGECTFCKSCAEACPERVFDTAGAPWDLAAGIDGACLAGDGIYCQSCRDVCSHGAIAFLPVLRSVPRPVVDATACTGCGGCISACPVGAIGLSAHLQEAGGRGTGSREAGG